MDHCFKELGHSVRIYIDNILVSSQDLEDYKQLLSKVFIILWNYGLKIKKAKCVFTADTISFLGHRLGSAGITIKENKVNTL